MLKHLEHPTCCHPKLFCLQKGNYCSTPLTIRGHIWAWLNFFDKLLIRRETIIHLSVLIGLQIKWVEFRENAWGFFPNFGSLKKQWNSKRILISTATYLVLKHFFWSCYNPPPTPLPPPAVYKPFQNPLLSYKPSICNQKFTVYMYEDVTWVWRKVQVYSQYFNHGLFS